MSKAEDKGRILLEKSDAVLAYLYEVGLYDSAQECINELEKAITALQLEYLKE